jgi:hypothetical protein
MSAIGLLELLARHLGCRCLKQRVREHALCADTVVAEILDGIIGPLDVLEDQTHHLYPLLHISPHLATGSRMANIEKKIVLSFTSVKLLIGDHHDACRFRFFLQIRAQRLPLRADRRTKK